VKQILQSVMIDSDFFKVQLFVISKKKWNECSPMVFCKRGRRNDDAMKLCCPDKK